MDFKIIFPAGYNITSESNDNLDVNVILENGEVYFICLFTLANIQYLIEKDAEPCFWATDMLIVKNLRKQTMREAITYTIKNNFIECTFTNIGRIEKRYPRMSFDEIPDMANGFDLVLNDD